MSEATENFEDTEKLLKSSYDKPREQSDSENVPQVNQDKKAPEFVDNVMSAGSTIAREELTPAIPISTVNKFSPQEQFIDPAIVTLEPSEKPTLAEKQEQTRSQLATFLLRILAGTLISSLVLILSLIYISTNVDEKKAETFDKTSALVKDLITFVITSQVGLIGTALGFYFGSKNNSD